MYEQHHADTSRPPTNASRMKSDKKQINNSLTFLLNCSFQTTEYLYNYSKSLNGGTSYWWYEIKDGRIIQL